MVFGRLEEVKGKLGTDPWLALEWEAQNYPSFVAHLFERHLRT